MDILDFIKNKTPNNIKICLVSGIISGLITHFYMLTHKIPNWDDISQINGIGLTSEIGRWMLEPLWSIARKASNPAINGVLFIFFISISACLIVSSCKIETTTASILIPAVMITFPSVTGILYFMFTAHIYAIGILLFCLSSFLIQKYKYGFVPAGIGIIMALAIYQPFVSFAISLMILMLVMEALKGQDFKLLVKRGGVYASTLAFSTFLYIIISRVFFLNVEKEKYGGVDEMGQMAIVDIPKNFGRVYKRVLEYFITKPFAYVTEGMRLLNISACFLVVVLFIMCVAKLKLWRKKLEMAFMCLMLFLLPFAIGFVYFMAPDAPFSSLMLYAYTMLYILVIALAENVFASNNYREKMTNRVENTFQVIGVITTTVVIVLIVYGNYLLDAQAYFRSSIAVERVTNYYNRIISRVEGMDEYQVGDRVAILGEFYYKTNPAPVEIRLFEDDERYRELDGVVLENGLITSGVRNNFIRTYLGFDPGRVSDEERKALMKTESYKKMQTYPKEGSVYKIGDIWVVKLCE